MLIGFNSLAIIIHLNLSGFIAKVTNSVEDIKKIAQIL
ncbi:hypothetical protein PAUR_a1833 [Pseudoalteromonas aurantia 208]|uniref:Uncharacterized protein n=1 Tax=Pseudoalteromonas aurantia 208 TaxID=1314867 RepID=A0ABR9EBB3_9GAMM|nr:hypothetical protein [Pseudoalteromonas aurantia 208]